MKKRFFSFIVFILGLVLLAGCKETKVDFKEAITELTSIFQEGDTKDSVTKDLVLRLESSVLEGAEITWESSNKEVITNGGKVTRKQDDVSVTLTLKIVFDKQEAEEKITVKVLKLVEPVMVTFDYDIDKVEDLVVTKNKGEVVAEPALKNKEGYKFLGWYLGDAKYDFKEAVIGSITLVAKWEKIATFKLTLPEGVKADVKDPLNVLKDTKVTLTVNVPEGKVLDKLTVDGNVVSVTDNKYSFIISKNTTVTVDFRESAVETVILTLPEGVKASVSDLTKVAKDTEVTLTVNVPSGKILSKLLVDGVEVTATDNKYTFTITKDTEVKVEYSLVNNNVKEVLLKEKDEEVLLTAVVTGIITDKLAVLSDADGVSIYLSGDTKDIKVFDKVELKGKRAVVNGLNQVVLEGIITVLESNIEVDTAITKEFNELTEADQGRKVSYPGQEIVDINTTSRTVTLTNGSLIRFEDKSLFELYKKGDKVDVNGAFVGWFNSRQLYAVEGTLVLEELSREEIVAIVLDKLKEIYPDVTNTVLSGTAASLPAAIIVNADVTVDITWANLENVVDGKWTGNNVTVKVSASFVVLETEEAFEATVFIENSNMELTSEFGFEDSEGFKASNVYNNSEEKLFGNEDTAWATYYGTPATTGAISGNQSMQMRWYTNAKDALGYVRTDFILEGLKRIEFSAANTNGLNVALYVSSDKVKWQLVETYNLTTKNEEYSHVFADAADLYIKFVVVLPEKAPSATSRVYIDDVKIYTKTEPKELFDVNFDVDGGTKVEAVKIFDGALIKEPQTTKVGFQIEGWYKDELLTEKWNFSVDKVTGPTTLYVKWEVATYNVVFKDAEDIVKEETVTHNNPVNKPTDLEKPGFIFVGWELDGELYNFESLVTEDLVLVARFLAKEVIEELQVSLDASKTEVLEGKLYITVVLTETEEVSFEEVVEISNLTFVFEKETSDKVYKVNVNLESLFKELTIVDTDVIAYNAEREIWYQKRLLKDGENPLSTDDAIYLTNTGLDGLWGDLRTPTGEGTDPAFWTNINAETGLRKYIYIMNDVIYLGEYNTVQKFVVLFEGINNYKQVIEANALINKDDINYEVDNQYDFIYWMLDGVEFDFNTEITKNITLVPNLINVYKVTLGERVTVLEDLNLDRVREDTAVTVNVKADLGKKIKELKVNDVVYTDAVGKFEFSFELVITEETNIVVTYEETEITLEASLLAAKSYVYSDGFTYYKDPSSLLEGEKAIYTIEEFYVNKYALNDLARALGALYRVDNSSIKKIVFNEVEYTWIIKEKENKGSNWYYGDTSLVSVITEESNEGVREFTLILKDDSNNELTINAGFNILINAAFEKTGRIGIVPAGNGVHSGNLTLEFKVVYLGEFEEFKGQELPLDASFVKEGTVKRDGLVEALTINADETLWANILKNGVSEYEFIAHNGDLIRATLDVNEYLEEAELERTNTPVSNLIANDPSFYLEYILKNKDGEIAITASNLKNVYALNTTNEDKWQERTIFGEDPYYLQLATGATGLRYLVVVDKNDNIHVATLNHVEVLVDEIKESNSVLYLEGTKLYREYQHETKLVENLEGTTLNEAIDLRKENETILVSKEIVSDVKYYFIKEYNSKFNEVIFDNTNPELVSKQLEVINGKLVLTIETNDLNPYSLEIDHNLQGKLPEFTVYANAANPYGTEAAKTEFESKGLTVVYDNGKWTLTFNEALTTNIKELATTKFAVYFVIEDFAGNAFGTMYGVTKENTVELPIFNVSYKVYEETKNLRVFQDEVLELDTPESNNKYETEFDAWYVENTKYDFDPVTKDLVLEARFKEIKYLTIAEVLALPTGTDVKVRVIVDKRVSKDNFDIIDQTGTLRIYKSGTDTLLNSALGKEVVIIGKRAVHNNNPQITWETVKVIGDVTDERKLYYITNSDLSEISKFEVEINDPENLPTEITRVGFKAEILWDLDAYVTDDKFNDVEQTTTVEITGYLMIGTVEHEIKAELTIKKVMIYTITFKVTGFDDVVATYKENEQVLEPVFAIPTGSKITGWYLDQDFTEVYGFDVAQKDLIVYGKVEATDYVHVTYNLNDGVFAEVPSTEYEKNAKLIKPVDPTKEGFAFGGWFKEATFETEWNFTDDVIAENIALYAKWEEKTEPILVRESDFGKTNDTNTSYGVISNIKIKNGDDDVDPNGESTWTTNGMNLNNTGWDFAKFGKKSTESKMDNNYAQTEFQLEKINKISVSVEAVASNTKIFVQTSSDKETWTNIASVDAVVGDNIIEFSSTENTYFRIVFYTSSKATSKNGWLIQIKLIKFYS